MVENFLAVLSLESPLILNRPLVGDSLLAGIKFAHCHDPVIAIHDLPVAHVEDVPQISVLLLGPIASLRQATIIQSMMRDMDHEPDLADMLDKMPPASALNPSSGIFVNIWNTYHILDVRTVFFIGRGDIDRVEQLLKSIPFIGSQHAKGYGQVANVDVIPVDTDNPMYGIVGRQNGRSRMLRPMPTRYSAMIPPDTEYIISTETWKNPYNTRITGAVAEPCMVPHFANGEFFTEKMLLDM